MVMWLLILQSLKTHFHNATGLSDMAGNIKVGSNEAIPAYPAIRIRRAGEANVRKFSVTSPQTMPKTVNVWIDCWEGSDDPDPEMAYVKLAALESKIVEALDVWAKLLPGLPFRNAVVELTHGAPDGDEWRPACGSRLILQVTFRD